MVVLLIAACSAAVGPVGSRPLPEITEPEKAVDVVVIRKRSLPFTGKTHFITLDGKKIFGINPGEYTRFKVSYGTHKIGVNCDHGVIPSPIPKQNQIHVNLTPGTTAYYFIGNSGIDCVSIAEIEGGEGVDLMRKSIYRSFEVAH